MKSHGQTQSYLTVNKVIVENTCL